MDLGFSQTQRTPAYYAGGRGPGLEAVEPTNPSVCQVGRV